MSCINDLEGLELENPCSNAVETAKPVFLEPVRVRSDGDGDTYLIPESKISDFDIELEFLNSSSVFHYDACERFTQKYSEYRIGDVESIKFYIIPSNNDL